MKRYRPGIWYGKPEMYLDPDGEWAKADIAEELYEVVLELSVYTDSPVPNTLIDLAGRVKNKAEEEG